MHFTKVVSVLSLAAAAAAAPAPAPAVGDNFISAGMNVNAATGASLAKQRALLTFRQTGINNANSIIAAIQKAADAEAAANDGSAVKTWAPFNSLCTTTDEAKNRVIQTCGLFAPDYCAAIAAKIPSASAVQLGTDVVSLFNNRGGKKVKRFLGDQYVGLGMNVDAATGAKYARTRATLSSNQRGILSANVIISKIQKAADAEAAANGGSAVSTWAPFNSLCTTTDEAKNRIIQTCGLFASDYCVSLSSSSKSAVELGTSLVNIFNNRGGSRKVKRSLGLSAAAGAAKARQIAALTRNQTGINNANTIIGRIQKAADAEAAANGGSAVSTWAPFNSLCTTTDEAKNRIIETCGLYSPDKCQSLVSSSKTAVELGNAIIAAFNA